MGAIRGAHSRYKKQKLLFELNPEILTYYDQLANRYEEDRFANTYGQFIHEQESKVLTQYFRLTNADRNLDLACGTGRFLNYANFGIDISPNMVEIARQKFPEKDIKVGSAEQLPFKDGIFQNVLSFHLFMHLQREQVKEIFGEVNRVMAPGGRFIFDIPSHKRRKLTNYKSSSWHGAYQMDYNTVLETCKDKWEIEAYHGVAFLPIHRIPKKIRKQFIQLDNFLCRSWFREFSSHLIFVLRKK